MSVAPSWESVEPLLAGGVIDTPPRIADTVRRLLQEFRAASITAPSRLRVVEAGIEIEWEAEDRRATLTIGHDRTVDLCNWANDRLVSFGSVHADSAVHAYARFLGVIDGEGEDHIVERDAGGRS